MSILTHEETGTNDQVPAPQALPAIPPNADAEDLYDGAFKLLQARNMEAADAWAFAALQTWMHEKRPRWNALEPGSLAQKAWMILCRCNKRDMGEVQMALTRIWTRQNANAVADFAKE
jgi:hypothetical protein